MKKVLKLTLAVALVMSASSLYAQKFGRISTDELIVAMPEMKEAQANFETFQKDIQETYEVMRVEYNNKMADLQKNEATYSESMKQLKTKEIQDLINRIGEYEQNAQTEMQQKYAELMRPIQEKALAAINEVAKAGGYAAVFETGTFIYFDESQIADLMPAVKAKLGIQ